MTLPKRKPLRQHTGIVSGKRRTPTVANGKGKLPIFMGRARRIREDPRPAHGTTLKRKTTAANKTPERRGKRPCVRKRTETWRAEKRLNKETAPDRCAFSRQREQQSPERCGRLKKPRTGFRPSSPGKTKARKNFRALTKAGENAERREKQKRSYAREEEKRKEGRKENELPSAR